MMMMMIIDDDEDDDDDGPPGQWARAEGTKAAATAPWDGLEDASTRSTLRRGRRRQRGAKRGPAFRGRRPSGARVPHQGTPGGSGRPGTPTARGRRLRGEGGACRALLGIAASRVADSSAFGRTGGIGLAGPRSGQRRARCHRHRGDVEILDDCFDGRRAEVGARSSRVRSCRLTGRLYRVPPPRRRRRRLGRGVDLTVQ